MNRSLHGTAITACPPPLSWFRVRPPLCTWTSLSVIFLLVCFLRSPVAFADGLVVRPATAYKLHETQAGFTVAIQPVDDQKEQKSIFDVDVRSKDLRPVLVVLENETADISFLFDRGDLRCGDLQSSSEPADSYGSTSKGETVAKVGLVTLSPALGAIGGVLMAKAAGVRQKLIKRELRSATIPAGARAHGFVFVPLAEKGSLGGPLILQVRVWPSNQDQPVDFIFDVTEGEK